MNSFKALLFASIILIWSGCKPDDTVDCNFDQSAMLANYADNLIVPAFEELKTGVTLLDASVDVFVNDPNTANLVELRIAWLAAYKAFQRSSMFAIGPAIVDGAPFFERFNTFPTSQTGIETRIAADEADTENYGNAQVGFPAIGYLIFSSDDSTIVEGFVNDYTRGEYLQSLSEELLNTATQIDYGWNTFSSTFVANTGNSDGSSTAELVNAMVFDFETKKNFGFKIPLGKFNGGVVLPEQCESVFAGVSGELALDFFKASAKAFAGVSPGGSDGLGLTDHLECLQYGEDNGTFLHQRILEQFDEIETAVDAIPDPMSETLVSNKQVVDDAYDLMQEMVPMIKRDLTAALAIQITYQDNDGD